MPDVGKWIAETVPQLQEEVVALDVLFLRAALALMLGAGVGAVYRVTQRGSSSNPSFMATLVLLSILIAMVTQVIGESQALAFSLVGILSIVRFRTVVEDTRDTAFVIFAVVVGMAAGVGNLMVAAVAMVIVSVAAFALRILHLYAPEPIVEWTLQLRVGTGAPEGAAWEPLLAKHCSRVQMVSTATARQGAAMDLTYRIRLLPGITPLQFLNAVNRLEGIQNLELKRG